VLVHGAWAGSSGWDEVSANLHKVGYATATPGLGLASLADDTATVRTTLDAIPGDKILVEHSYGGAVISNAAYGRSDVLALVYTAGFAPDEGQTLLQLGEGYQPPAVLPHLIWSGAPFASPSLIDPAFFRDDFA
jgi:pimeloyl-ACP methyl ester carboxylesterase